MINLKLMVKIKYIIFYGIFENSLYKFRVRLDWTFIKQIKTNNSLN